MTIKTCSLCGETEGEAPGHTRIDATTEAPKTCAVCTTTACAPIFGKWDATQSPCPVTP